MNKEIKQQLSLRPNNFDEFIGQEKIIKTLKVVIDASKNKNKFLDHILFYGPPGLGKTTLANIVANFSKRNIIHVQGALLISKTDVLTLFASINEGDIVFIDEIHSINKNIEELLYSIIEDFVIDISIGPEGERKMMRMKIKPFTLICATTKMSLISKPLKDRFGLLLKLENYSIDNISNIVKQSAEKLSFKISNEHAKMLSIYSNLTPRIANTILMRIVDFCIYYKKNEMDDLIIKEVFENLSIYKYGLNINHIQYLKIFKSSEKNKSVSIDTISSWLNEDKKFIIEDIEPNLISLGFIFKNSRGRNITESGIQYLKDYKI